MPYTLVQLYNAALSNIGTRSRIASTSEGSKEANALNAVYEDVRDELLSQYAWNFATVREALEEQGVAEEPDDFDYVYARPTNCLKFLAVVPPGQDAVAQVPYALRLVEDDTTPAPVLVDAILTSIDDAVGVFVTRITDVDRMRPHFRRALSWRLAAAVALNLTAPPVAAAAARIAAQQFEVAVTIDAQEGLTKRDEALAPWTAAR